jgi:hypothetical protein
MFAVQDSATIGSVLTIANLDPEKGIFEIEIRDREGALLDARRAEVGARSTRELAVRADRLPAGENLTIVIRSDGARYAAWTTTRAPDAVPIITMGR